MHSHYSQQGERIGGHDFSICLGVISSGLHRKSRYKGKYLSKDSHKKMENVRTEVLLLNRTMQVEITRSRI